MNTNRFRQLNLRSTGSRPTRRRGNGLAARLVADANVMPLFVTPMGGTLDLELSSRDSVVMMLQAAAEIEHALMIQYLFAGYSLRLGVPVPGTPGRTTTQWARGIIQTAKEEMGHLLVIQNALRLLGGPLHFDRDSFPIRSRFYPYPFELERLTVGSLSRFIAAEMPAETEIPDDVLSPTQIAQIKTDTGGAVNRVGLLFEAILSAIIGLNEASDLWPQHLQWQADPDQWRADFTIISDLPDPPASVAGIMAIRMSNKAELSEVLEFIADQGESPVQSGNDSHFERFAQVYRELEFAKQQDPLFEPSFPVVKNPNTTAPPEAGDILTPEEQAQELVAAAGRISDPRALLWAKLFNVRYRVLLTSLHHYFLVGRAEVPASPGELVGDTLVTWVFEEMLDAAGSLKDLARLLVTLPRNSEGNAGPPFELPYSLDLPDLGPQQWRLHRDLIKASAVLTGRLSQLPLSPAETTFINGILSRDGGTMGEGRQAFLERVKDMDV